MGHPYQQLGGMRSYREAIVKKTNYESWKFWEVPVRTDEGLCTTLRVLTEESEIERQAQLKQLKKDRKFWKYYELRKLFDNVPYSYAITTHKAQGSSIDYVALDVQDMVKCPDLQQMLN